MPRLWWSLVSSIYWNPSFYHNHWLLPTSLFLMFHVQKEWTSAGWRVVTAIQRMRHSCSGSGFGSQQLPGITQVPGHLTSSSDFRGHCRHMMSRHSASKTLICRKWNKRSLYFLFFKNGDSGIECVCWQLGASKCGYLELNSGPISPASTNCFCKSHLLSTHVQVTTADNLREFYLCFHTSSQTLVHTDSAHSLQRREHSNGHVLPFPHIILL